MKTAIKIMGAINRLAAVVPMTEIKEQKAFLASLPVQVSLIGLILRIASGETKGAFFMPVPIKGTISGSSAATILGLNDYESPLSFWQKLMEDREPGFNKRNGYELPEPFEGNAATRFGHAFEDACIELTEAKLGEPIVDREAVFCEDGCYEPIAEKLGEPIVDREPVFIDTFLSCHVDGIIDGGNQLYEGKTVYIRGFQSKWGDPGSGRIPRNYMLQVQHNMYLSDTNEAVVSCLVFPETPEKWEEIGWEVEKRFSDSYQLVRIIRDYEESEAASPVDWARSLSAMGFHHLYHIKRDDELIAKMLEKYKEFWQKYVITGIPPEPMNVDDIKRLCPDVSGTIVIEDETLLGYIEEYKEIGKEIGSGGNLEKRRQQLKTHFLDGCRKLGKTVDDESTDKWIFRDPRGKKLGSWGKNKNGTWVFR